jgi:hypothetical protein
MTGPAPPDWAEIKRLYLETDEPITSISERFGVPLGTIGSRVKAEDWRPRRAERMGLKLPPRRASRGDGRMLRTRRNLIRRLYKLIDAKLKLMELRMDQELEGEGRTACAADHERDSRALGTLIRNLERMSEIDVGLKRGKDGRPSSAAALADEADRLRRELAQRLARFVKRTP